MKLGLNLHYSAFLNAGVLKYGPYTKPFPTLFPIIFFAQKPPLLCLDGVSVHWVSPVHVNRSIWLWQHDLAQQSFMAQWARAFSITMMSWLAAIVALPGTSPGLYFTTIYYSRVCWCLINLHKLNLWGERFHLLQQVTGARLLLNWNSTHCMSSHMYLL